MTPGATGRVASPVVAAVDPFGSASAFGLLAVTAVLLAAGAGWVAFGAAWPARLRDAGVGGAAGSGAGRSGVPTDPRRASAVVTGSRVVVVSVVMACAVVAGGPATVVCGLAAAGTAVGLRIRADRHRRAAAAERRQAVIDACVALAACLRGGAGAEAALARTAQETPTLALLLAPAVNAAQVGGDVPEALVRCSGPPGAYGLRRVAACWQVAAANGAALADTLDRLTRGLRDDEAYRREVEAQLAGPRATARLLAVLPVLGLVLGAAAGANPVRVLLGTGPGLACLAVGSLLAAAGLVWMRRLAASVEPTW